MNQKATESKRKRHALLQNVVHDSFCINVHKGQPFVGEVFTAWKSGDVCRVDFVGQWNVKAISRAFAVFFMQLGR